MYLRVMPLNSCVAAHRAGGANLPQPVPPTTGDLPVPPPLPPTPDVPPPEIVEPPLPGGHFPLLGTGAPYFGVVPARPMRCNSYE